MPNIEISLSIDDTNAVATFAEVGRQARETFAQTVVTSIEKAQQKLFELNRSLQNHGSIIDANKQKITDLESKRASANQAELQRINSEITALNQLNQQRTLDSSKIEEKKAKVQALIAATQAASEQEKLGIQLTTQQRIIEIGVLRDTEKAHNAIRETATKAIEKVSEKIDALIGKQLAHQSAIDADKRKVEELFQAHQNATEASRKDIEQEIASVQRAIASRETAQLTLQEQITLLERKAALSKATSDSERQQIEATTQARMGQIAAQKDELKAQQSVKDTFTKATDEQLAEMDALNAKHKQEQTVLEQDKRLLADLRQKRSEASGEDKRSIEQQIEQLKKVMSAREQEIFTIQTKQLRLEEVMKLAVAGSDAERDAIKAATQERITEIEVIRDQARATAAVREETNDGATAVDNYFQMFAGAASAIFSLNTIKQVLEENAAIMERSIDAGQRMRDMAGAQYGKAKSFFDEMGLNTAESQKAGQETINAIASSQNIEQSTATATLAGMAGPLKQSGIGDHQSDRFRSLVGNAARYVNRGLDPKLVGSFTTDALDPKVGGNANLTGDELNQQLGNIMAVGHGSASRANELLQVFQEDKTRLQNAGFNQNDAARLFQHLQRTTAPAEIPSVARQFFQSSTRLEGLSPKQMLDMHQQMGDYTPIQMDILHQRAEYEKPEQLFEHQISGRSGGVSELDNVFRKGIKTGNIDAREALRVLGTMSEEKRKRAARVIAGPRGEVAMTRGVGFEGEGLPTGAMLSPPDAPELETARRKEQADAAFAASHRPDPFEEQFNENVKNETTYVTENPDKYMSFWERHPSVGKVASMGAPLANAKEIAAGRVLWRQFLHLGKRAEEIRSGKRQAKSGEAQEIHGVMGDIEKLLGHEGYGGPMRALIEGSSSDGTTTTTAAQVLSGIANEDDFITDNIDKDALATYGNRITDPKQSGPIFRRAEAVEKSLMSPSPSSNRAFPATQPTTRPATQPSGPTSINYHNRNVYYGIPYSDIGSPQESGNRYG